MSGGRAMAARDGARGALSPHTPLFDMPPPLLGELCAILDSCDGALGWRGLGECGLGGGAAGKQRGEAARPAGPLGAALDAALDRLGAGR